MGKNWHRRYTRKHIKRHRHHEWKPKRRKNIGGTIFLIILIVIWLVWGSYDYENPFDYLSGDKIKINGKANSNFLYFPSKPISYKFDSFWPCSGEMKDRILSGLAIIESETEGIVPFVEDPENGKVSFNCHSSFETEAASGYGGPIYYEGERKILEGEVDLWTHNPEFLRCESYPTTEIHEILHVFGFDHIYSEDSIMHPGGGEIILHEWEDDQSYVCKEMDLEIVECLKNIYSNGVNGSSCSGFLSL